MRTPKLLLLLSVVVSAMSILSACDPTGGAGPTSGGSGDRPNTLGDSGDPGGGSDPAPLHTSLSVSGSPVDAHQQTGAPASGAYELYLWLVCASEGVGLLEADIEIVGDDLSFADHYFSPAENVVSAVSEGGGDLNLTLQGCPSTETLLGTLHLDGDGAGTRVHLKDSGENDGSYTCDATRSAPFDCLGYASDGRPPTRYQAQFGCAPTSSTNQFAISASDASPHQQSLPAEEGWYVLYLWSVSGVFSAMEADIHVIGGITESDPTFDPAFAPVPPFLGLITENGPDILLAAPGCQGGTVLVGTIVMHADSVPSTVTIVATANGGTVTCDTVGPSLNELACTPFHFE